MITRVQLKNRLNAKTIVTAVAIFALTLSPLSSLPVQAQQPASGVLINEIKPATGSGSTRWIELYNASDEVVDISRWRLQRSGATVGNLVFPPLTAIAARSFYIHDVTSGSLPLSGGGSPVLLLNGPNGAVVDSMDYAVDTEGQSYGRTYDGGSVASILMTPTRAGSNGSPPQPVSPPPTSDPEAPSPSPDPEPEPPVTSEPPVVTPEPPMPQPDPQPDPQPPVIMPPQEPETPVTPVPPSSEQQPVTTPPARPPSVTTTSNGAAVITSLGEPTPTLATPLVLPQQVAAFSGRNNVALESNTEREADTTANQDVLKPVVQEGVDDIVATTSVGSVDQDDASGYLTSISWYVWLVIVAGATSVWLAVAAYIRYRRASSDYS